MHQLKGRHNPLFLGGREHLPMHATCEVKTERANERQLLFILHSRDLDVKKLKWIYIYTSDKDEKNRDYRKNYKKEQLF